MLQCCVFDRSGRVVPRWTRIVHFVTLVAIVAACSSLRSELQLRTHVKLNASKWCQLTVDAPRGPGRLLVELTNAGPGEAYYAAAFDDGEVVAEGSLGLDYTQFSCKPLRRKLIIKLSTAEAATVLAEIHKGILLEDISLKTETVDPAAPR